MYIYKTKHWPKATFTAVKQGLSSVSWMEFAPMQWALVHHRFECKGKCERS